MEKNILEYLTTRHKPENINSRHKQSLKLQEKIALYLTRAVGTMYAVYLTLIFIFGWMLWQSYLAKQPIDPYPFAFLLFIGSIIQLPMMSLIMVGQNLQGRHAQLRSEEEFKATQSTYQDIEKILIHLDEQDKEIAQLNKLIQNSNSAGKSV